MAHAGSLSSSGSEFRIIVPAIGKARWPYVLSWQCYTMSRCWCAERNRCRDVTSVTGLMCSARYRGAYLCKQRYVMRPSLKVTLRHIQPVQFVMQEYRQTAIKLLLVADYLGSTVEHSLQLICDRFRSSCIDSIAIINL